MLTFNQKLWNLSIFLEIFCTHCSVGFLTQQRSKQIWYIPEKAFWFWVTRKYTFKTIKDPESYYFSKCWFKGIKNWCRVHLASCPQDAKYLLQNFRNLFVAVFTMWRLMPPLQELACWNGIRSANNELWQDFRMLEYKSFFETVSKTVMQEN